MLTCHPGISWSWLNPLNYQSVLTQRYAFKHLIETPFKFSNHALLKNWTSQPAITPRNTSRLNILIFPPHMIKLMMTHAKNSRMSSMAETCWKYTLKWLRHMPNVSRHAFARLCFMAGSSARPPGVAQKFCSFIGKFVFLTVQALTAVLIWKKMQKLTCSGWNSEIWACYANDTLGSSISQIHKLSGRGSQLPFFLGWRMATWITSTLSSFHTPLDMAPGSDFHGTLTCSVRVAKLDSLNSCCCWGRWFFVPFEDRKSVV